MTCLSLAGVLTATYGCGVRPMPTSQLDQRFAGARWIAGNEVTYPDADFGNARWIASIGGADVAFERRFILKEKPNLAELVFVAWEKVDIEINGLRRFGGAARDLGPVGDFHNWRYAKFVDAAPALKTGENVIRMKASAPDGTRPAALLSLSLPDGFRVVTDASWANAEEIGTVRDVPWAKDLVLRREVNSPAFEKRFDVEIPVRKATLAITGLGFYEATLNGRRVGDKRLDPIPSNYDKRVYYSVYDVTDALKKGVNVLNVLLGHGWYDVRAVATWNWDMAPWRAKPRLLARLDIEGTDGSRACVVSDGSWRQVESPVGFDCIREGEVIGARNRRAIDLTEKVVLAQEVEAPKGRLVEEKVPPTVVKRVVPAVRVDKVGDVWRVDFGEDLAGVMRMRFSDAVRGRVVSFRYDERDGVTVDPVDERDGTDAIGDGRPERRIDCHFGWTASHDVLPGGVFQCDRYVTRGEVGEVYEPRFTYNGFRYVFIDGLGRAPRTDECEALVLQTDFESIGSFECSDPTFSSLVKMADKAYRSNFVNGFPTDCPHREKNGWTADAALASEMAMYAYENTASYSDWLEQVAESQRDDGMIAEIVPTSGWGYHGFLDWDAVLAILPETIYRYRGDSRPLVRMYPTLTNYLEKVAIPNLKDGLCRNVRGDWVSAGTRPDKGIVGTCYFKLMAETAALTSRLLNRPDEVIRYSRLAEEARTAFNRSYARPNGFYGDGRGRQTTQAMALEFGMVPKADEPAARARLVEAVLAADGHLDFGLHGMKWVPRALSKAGRTDLAFRMFVKDTAPSPAMWLKRGGTSLWEDWGNGASRNHIMFGEFVCWAYQYLAGIRLAEDGMGFRKVIIDPRPIADLDWVKGSVRLPTGLLLSSWKRVNGAVNLRVSVPSHVEAQVCLPSGVEILCGPAVREWEYSKWNCGQGPAGGL